MGNRWSVEDSRRSSPNCGTKGSGTLSGPRARPRWRAAAERYVRSGLRPGVERGSSSACHGRFSEELVRKSGRHRSIRRRYGGQQEGEERAFQTCASGERRGAAHLAPGRGAGRLRQRRRGGRRGVRGDDQRRGPASHRGRALHADRGRDHPTQHRRHQHQHGDAVGGGADQRPHRVADAAVGRRGAQQGQPDAGQRRRPARHLPGQPDRARRRLRLRVAGAAGAAQRLHRERVGAHQEAVRADSAHRQPDDDAGRQHLLDRLDVADPPEPALRQGVVQRPVHGNPRYGHSRHHRRLPGTAAQGQGHRRERQRRPPTTRFRSPARRARFRSSLP